MRKGITPVIATIVLLLVTVALAGTAWTFLQGYIQPQISKNFLIPPKFSYCSVNGTGTYIKVYIRNTALQADIIAGGPASGGDFDLAKVDDYDLLSPIDRMEGAPSSPASIAVGKSGLVLDYNCDTIPENPGICSSGYHTISLKTVSSVQHTSVFCP